jgi:hypothetical protein
MRTKQVEYQLAPPHCHCRNAAERAIRTWKNHFITGLASIDKQFPLHLWDQLIPQAVTTLNLLRQSRLNPRLSADAQLNGIHGFNRAPMAPPGTKVIIHEKPTQRGTWAPHGVQGWYLGPAPEHYTCHQVYVTKTAAERTSDTVEFFPERCIMPRLSSTDTIVKSAIDLIDALRNPSPAAPFAKLGEEQLVALHQLSSKGGEPTTTIRYVTTEGAQPKPKPSTDNHDCPTTVSDTIPKKYRPMQSCARSHTVHLIPHHTRNIRDPTPPSLQCSNRPSYRQSTGVSTTHRRPHHTRRLATCCCQRIW